MVRAISLAAHGFGAAVADGTAITAAATPPITHAADAPCRLRRTVRGAVVFMENSLRFADTYPIARTGEFTVNAHGTETAEPHRAIRGQHEANQRPVAAGRSL